MKTRERRTKGGQFAVLKVANEGIPSLKGTAGRVDPHLMASTEQHEPGRECEWMLNVPKDAPPPPLPEAHLHTAEAQSGTLDSQNVTPPAAPANAPRANEVREASAHQGAVVGAARNSPPPSSSSLASPLVIIPDTSAPRSTSETVSGDRAHSPLRLAAPVQTVGAQGTALIVNSSTPSSPSSTTPAHLPQGSTQPSPAPSLALTQHETAAHQSPSSILLSRLLSVCPSAALDVAKCVAPDGADKAGSSRAVWAPITWGAVSFAPLGPRPDTQYFALVHNAEDTVFVAGDELEWRHEQQHARGVLVAITHPVHSHSYYFHMLLGKGIWRFTFSLHSFTRCGPHHSFAALSALITKCTIYEHPPELQYVSIQHACTDLCE